MKTLRRFDIRQTYYFITVATHKRERLLLRDTGLFWNCWKNVDINTWVILPDHFHLLLLIENVGISKIIHNFKITYSRRYRDRYRKGRVWQNRFWDHIIRNQVDMNRHIDYIHYNPVKHRLTDDPFAYEHSSLNKYFAEGYYQRDWGVKEKLQFDGDYGE